ncbi:hypothetical protein DPM19_08355 [Actinomadura craniellae]|uniref:ATP/GTP-binding protein n=1 Tax=Actinomadura craniellae TaxID=2231787 RepID=A0A365HA14_9ACTN|nr:hypothetical protein [Actinomadura craniellae]RAY15776.1 hypothetical protein DPM19_08355 [Actinomadura craniellae]
MSPRRNRRDGGPDERPPGGGAWLERTEDGPDGEWIVRVVSGASAVKAYRCPGCDQEIPPGTGHLVAWPADVGSIEDRRHWHQPCWRARTRRGPTGRRF